METPQGLTTSPSEVPPNLIWDIETDGLLDQLTKVHCLSLRDADTGAVIGSYADQPGYPSILEGLAVMDRADLLIGHNILDFDCRAIEKVYPGRCINRKKCRDTLLLGRVLWPEVRVGDMVRFKKGSFPGKLVGRHGLEAWGHRLGEHKGEYTDWCKANGITDPWSTWRPEMQSYMDQDTNVNWKLWRRIQAKNLDQRCIELEHQVALLCLDITANGFPFDTAGAQALFGQLVDLRDAAVRRLQEAFPPIERLTVFVPKKNNGPRGYLAGVPVEKRRLVDFNPASGQDIAERLIAKYGWKPTQFTQGRVGKDGVRRPEVQVTETVLEGLPYPEISDLLDYLLFAKITSMLAATKGQKGWLKLEKLGRIHGEYATAGAVTGRATHSKPNIAQVPAVEATKTGHVEGKAGGFGWECRSLFGAAFVRPEWCSWDPALVTQVGADQAGLELRCFAHFLAPLDGGRYVQIVTEGDVHTANQEAAGLPTRANAKTFIYAYLYGAGAWKLGHIVAPLASDEEKERIGRALQAQFLARTPGLKGLRDRIKKTVRDRGFLIGLDGRPLTIRKEHAALNTLLQSAGALVCKQWIISCDRTLRNRGLSPGFMGDYAPLAWVHDELQVACRTPEIAEVVAEVCKSEAALAGQFFGFRCPTAGDAKIGRTWAVCH